MIETKHTPDQGKSKLSDMGKRFFRLIEFDDNEELLLEIRKHPFGLVILLVIGAIVGFSVLVATFLFASSGFLSDIELDGARPFFALIGFILTVLVIVATAVYAQLYRSDVVYVTNEKVAQVLYQTIFHRKVSQLNIGDVQDVSVTQQGIFAHMFDYGTLVIETAGEQQNYTFTFVPTPHQAAKAIITSHEANLKQYGN
jgi:uncharacterized membrane protein YdbT with pleckstrin-like domain